MFPILILAAYACKYVAGMKARRKKIESPASVGVSDAFGYATEGMHVSA